MIPAYKQPVVVEQIEVDPSLSLAQQLQQLREHVANLHETVSYLQRENSRLKSDIQTLAQAINRQ